MISSRAFIRRFICFRCTDHPLSFFSGSDRRKTNRNQITMELELNTMELELNTMELELNTMELELNTMELELNTMEFGIEYDGIWN